MSMCTDDRFHLVVLECLRCREVSYRCKQVFLSSFFPILLCDSCLLSLRQVFVLRDRGTLGFARRIGILTYG
uniref:Uncharacterized protein n=1 Tax=Arundo donax TaxID=35708 RepID=A0A0A9CH43_ARUDO